MGLLIYIYGRSYCQSFGSRKKCFSCVHIGRFSWRLGTLQINTHRVPASPFFTSCYPCSCARKTVLLLLWMIFFPISKLIVEFRGHRENSQSWPGARNMYYCRMYIIWWNCNCWNFLQLCCLHIRLGKTFFHIDRKPSMVYQCIGRSWLDKLRLWNINSEWPHKINNFIFVSVLGLTKNKIRI